MRHTLSIKEKVRQLRSEGLSLGEIFSQTAVPKTTIRTWIKDILLSDAQKIIINQNALNRLQAGRIRVQTANKLVKVKKMNMFLEVGKKDIGILSKREVFLTGVALYWGEGFKNKHEHRLGFCNSDPTMVKFYLYWLEQCLSVKKEDIVLRVTLNKVYEKKTKEIQSYWSNYLEIPLTQFTKPFYQASVWKKQYKTDTYSGVLRIHVKNSLPYLLKMRGWIEGLRLNMAG